MPPVSKQILVKITPDLLDLQHVTNFVQDNTAGAIATFSGVTRDSFDGKKVIQLEYEAYHVMAERVLQVCYLIRFEGCTHTFLTIASHRTVVHGRKDLHTTDVHAAV